jgi:HSP20 family molecular chaperone IbpA
MAFQRRHPRNDYGWVMRFPDELLNGALSSALQDSGDSWGSGRPNVELHEEHDAYVVEAEVPGYRKEDIQVHVGDDGRSITLSGTATKGQQQRQAQPDSSGSQSQKQTGM